MDHYKYEGVRPAVRKLAAKAGCDPAKAEGNRSLSRLNALLGQAAMHLNKYDAVSAKAALDTARMHVVELHVAAGAAAQMYAEVEAALADPPKADPPPVVPASPGSDPATRGRDPWFDEVPPDVNFPPTPDPFDLEVPAVPENIVVSNPPVLQPVEDAAGPPKGGKRK